MHFSQPYISERIDLRSVGEPRRDYSCLALLMALSLLAVLTGPAQAEHTSAGSVTNADLVSIMNALPHRELTLAAESVQRSRMIRVRRTKPLQNRARMCARTATQWAQLEVKLRPVRTSGNFTPILPVVFDGHSSLPPPLNNVCPQRIFAPSEILSPEFLTARAGLSARETRCSAAPPRATCAPGTLSQIPACNPT